MIILHKSGRALRPADAAFETNRRFFEEVQRVLTDWGRPIPAAFYAAAVAGISTKGAECREHVRTATTALLQQVYQPGMRYLVLLRMMQKAMYLLVLYVYYETNSTARAYGGIFCLVVLRLRYAVDISRLLAGSVFNDWNSIINGRPATPEQVGMLRKLERVCGDVDVAIHNLQQAGADVATVTITVNSGDLETPFATLVMADQPSSGGVTQLFDGELR